MCMSYYIMLYQAVLVTVTKTLAASGSYPVTPRLSSTLPAGVYTSLRKSHSSVDSWKLATH